MSQDLWRLYSKLVDEGTLDAVLSGALGSCDAPLVAALPALQKLVDVDRKGPPDKPIRMRLEGDFEHLVAFLVRRTGKLISDAPWRWIAIACAATNLSFLFGSRMSMNSVTLSGAEWLTKLGLLVVAGFVHELAHATTATALGAPSSKIGVGFRGPIPVFYADVNHVWGLPTASRLCVNAAGIVAQLIIGSIAVAWFCVYPSNVLRAFIEINLFLTLINALPLTRLDGYWFIADLYDRPNLHKSSLKYAWKFVTGHTSIHNKKELFQLGYSIMFIVLMAALLRAIVRSVENMINDISLFVETGNTSLFVIHAYSYLLLALMTVVVMRPVLRFVASVRRPAAESAA